MKYSLHFIDEVTGYTEIIISEVYFKARISKRNRWTLKEYRSCLYSSKTSNKELRMLPVGYKFLECICLNTVTNKSLLWGFAWFYSIFIRKSIMRFQIYRSASHKPNIFALLGNTCLTANLTDSKRTVSSQLVHDHQEYAARNSVRNFNWWR